MTWDIIQNNFPEDREEMSEERQKEFVEFAFKAYEEEGFAKVYWTPYEFSEDKIGKSFEVLGRLSEATTELNELPMWNIMFKDGTIIQAYPEEVIPSMMQLNGCLIEEVLAQVKD